MFSKLVVSTLFLLSAASSVSAHAAFAPVLGVSGTPVRADVQRPKKNTPCGKTDIASTMASSTAAPLAADGSFTLTATNFNPGADGSRAIKTALVDPTGTGNSFNAEATVTTNGDPRPKSDGSEQLTLQMPAGMTCTGGADGASCLVSLTSTFGFGNCAVVSSAGTANATAASTGATGTAAAGEAAGTAAAGTAATGTASDGTAASGTTATDGTTAAGTTASGTTAAGTTAAGTAAGSGSGATTATTGSEQKSKGIGSAAAQAAAIAKAAKQAKAAAAQD